MKKILAILLAGVMTATAFAGCTGGSGEESSNNSSSGSSNSGSGASATQADVATGKVDESLFGDEGADGSTITLKVWAPDATVNLAKEQIEAFKKLYPDKKFDISVVAQGEGDAATALMNDATTAADVFSFPSDQLNLLVDAGVISPCAFADVVSSANQEETVTAGTINDELYAYPETNDNGYYLVYDKSVVSDEQAGKLEDILAACQEAGKQFVMDCGDGFYSCTFAFTAGVQVDGLEEDGITQKFVDYDEDAAVKTLQAFGKLIKKYKGTFVSLNVKNVASGFASDTCGAGIDGSWDTSVNEEALGDNFGAAKLPTINVDGEDKQLISMFGYKYLGVNGSSKFPASAQILAFYLGSQVCQQQRAEELGWGPSNLEVQKDKVVTDSAVLQAIAEQASNSCAQVNIAKTFWDPMANLGNQLIADEFNPDDTDAIKQLLKATIENIRDEG